MIEDKTHHSHLSSSHSIASPSSRLWRAQLEMLWRSAHQSLCGQLRLPLPPPLLQESQGDRGCCTPPSPPSCLYRERSLTCGTAQPGFTVQNVRKREFAITIRMRPHVWIRAFRYWDETKTSTCTIKKTSEPTNHQGANPCPRPFTLRLVSSDFFRTGHTAAAAAAAV